MFGFVRGVALAAAGMLAAASLSTLAYAERRVALVIGNSAYKNVARLDNPQNDASLIGKALTANGFGVTMAPDLDHAKFVSALRAFEREADGADWAVVYYAGHGMEMAGVNYLIPVDAKLERDRDIGDETVTLDRVLAAVEGAKALRLVILDACRNNPFLAKMSRSTAGGRDIGRGLAMVAPTQGTLVAYAAAAGTIASDGANGNSPFAASLAQHINEPGVEVRRLFGLVTDDVLEATAKRQQPFTYGSLPGRQDFYFRPPVGGGAAPAVDPIMADYQAAERFGTAAAWEAFLRKYQPSQPDNFYVTLAKDARAKVAALPPPNVAPAGPASPSRPPIAVDWERALPLYRANAMSLAQLVQSCPGVAVATIGAPSVTVANSLRCLAAKEGFRDCADICPEMVVVPAGSFTMGSPAEEKDREAREGPAHGVTIPVAFAVGKFAVTRGEFAAFVSDTNYKVGGSCFVVDASTLKDAPGKSFRDPGFRQDDRHPAVCISWGDAKAYVAWLARKTGKPYRLLTEAEYEYAHRAGTATPYWFGGDGSNPCNYANGADATTKAQFAGLVAASCSDGYAFTAPAGSSAGNGFGLFDMAGNAWSWTEDCYHDSYDGAPKGGEAWTAGGCDRRVVRGGTWSGSPRVLRGASRAANAPDFRANIYGFRVARALTP